MARSFHELLLHQWLIGLGVASSDTPTSPLSMPARSSAQMTMPESMTSYQVELVDADDNNRYDIGCAICKGTVWQPSETPCCHRLYCSSCLRHALENTAPTCPTCRKPLTPDTDIKPLSETNPGLWRLVSRVRIHCPAQKANGCTWLGEMGDAKSHVDKCPKQPILCVYPGCSALVARDGMDIHQSECVRRPLSCPDCKDTRLVAADLDPITGSHLSVCPERMVDCEECKARVLNKDKEKHSRGECPAALVTCCYAEFGCPVKRIRLVDRATHEADSSLHAVCLPMMARALATSMAASASSRPTVAGQAAVVPSPPTGMLILGGCNGMTSIGGMWSVHFKTRKTVECTSTCDWPSDARLPNQCSTIWRDWVVVVGGGPHHPGVSASVPSRMSEKVHVFSISERRWLFPSPISPMHEARMSASVVPLSDTQLMVCGGVTVVGGVPSECKTVEVFDLKTGSWSCAPSMQTARACSGVSYWKGRVYVVGGSARPCSSMEKVIPSAEVYDIKTRTWSDIASPTLARSRLTLIATNHGLYALGGLTSADQGVGVRDTSLVEMYHPEFDMWQTAKWELTMDGAFVGFEAGPWMIGYHPTARRLTFRRVDIPSKCSVVHLSGIPRQTWCTVVPTYD